MTASPNKHYRGLHGNEENGNTAVTAGITWYWGNTGRKYCGNCGDGDGFCGTTAREGSSFRGCTAGMVSLLMTAMQYFFTV